MTWHMDFFILVILVAHMVVGDQTGVVMVVAATGKEEATSIRMNSQKYFLQSPPSLHM